MHLHKHLSVSLSVSLQQCPVHIQPFTTNATVKISEYEDSLTLSLLHTIIIPF